MIFDTIALNPEAGKVTEMDIVIAEKLEKLFNFGSSSEARYDLFKELWAAHNDVSNLTPEQLLSKDLKIVDGVPVPGLPMLIIDYVKLPNAQEAISSFCKKKDSSILVIIGLHVDETGKKKQVRRDIAVYNIDEDCTLRNEIISNLNNAQKLKGYDFSLVEIPIHMPNMIYFKQENVKLTRKQILPLIREAIQIRK